MPVTSTAVQPILNAYDEGGAAQLVTGRSLLDIDLASDGEIRPLKEMLRRQFQDRGVVLIEFNLANGVHSYTSYFPDQRDRQEIRDALSDHDLLDIEQNEHELPRVLRGFNGLLRTLEGDYTWSDGSPMHFAVLLSFAEHVAPDVQTGMHTDPQVIAAQVTSMLGASLALQSSGNVFLLEGRGEMVDALVRDHLLEVRLEQPKSQEKERFLRSVLNLYDQATLEEELHIDQVTNLCSDTPNRSQESLIRASHFNKSPVTRQQFAERKARDIEALSERTLTLMSTENAEKLVGISVERPQNILLKKAAEALRTNDPTAPANVLLCGPPGTGKTMMSKNLARRAGVPAFELHTPKAGLVGETERLARLQQQVLGESRPHLAFVDEITEALPLQRSGPNNDGGASRAVGAALMSVMAEEDRRGSSLLIGTTNCPYRVGAAMMKRMTVLPVLFPVRPDYPFILAITIHRVSDAMATIPPQRLTEKVYVREAADLFFQKLASARDMRAALSNTAFLDGGLSPENIVQSALDYTGGQNRASIIYSELWSIRVTTSRAFFPWYGNSSEFPFPDHLKDIVDPETGEVDYDRLNERIDELEPYANV
jgi:hypothetical protein